MRLQVSSGGASSFVTAPRQTPSNGSKQKASETYGYWISI